MIDPALAALHKVLTSKYASDADKIRAAKEVMDRVEGYAPIRNTQHTGPAGGPIKVESEVITSALTFILSDAEAAAALDLAARTAAKALPAHEPVVAKPLKPASGE